MSFRIQSFPARIPGAERRYYFLLEGYIDEDTNAVRVTQDALWTGEAVPSLVYDGDGPIMPENMDGEVGDRIRAEYMRILTELMEAVRRVGRNA